MIEANIKTIQPIKLREVDGINVISLIDNSIDLLSSVKRKEVKQVREWVAEQKDQKWIRNHFHLPIAEHGFSALIKIKYGGKLTTILFDTGGSSNGVTTNAENMGLNLNEVECIVLSHGHYDHCGGLPAISKTINKNNLPIITHEDMFKTRGVENPDGSIRKYPEFPTEDKITPATYIKTRQPYLLNENTLLITGEIPRRTKFENGFEQHRTFKDDKWQPDPQILDDRAIVINIREKGLAVLSGCAHAGIINTIHYAQQITGINDIYAVMGGFHLAGEEYEKRINQTVKEMKKINPTILVPTHCTGWRGFYALREALPNACIWNSVGNLYNL